MADEALTASQYIKHHLQNMTYGQHADGTWGLAHTAEEAKEMGFMSINVDTMFWSILLGVLFLWIFRRAAKNATADTPSGLQNFIEMIIEFVDGSVKGARPHELAHICLDQFELQTLCSSLLPGCL